MNLVDGAMLPALAWLDPDGRLLDADTRLLELIRRAGGDIGEALPQPELAAVARLSKRLGIAIGRSIILADGDEDLELWVRAEPLRDGITITASGWTPRAPWRASDGGSRDLGFDKVEGDWAWETDAALRLTHITVHAGDRWGFEVAELLGQPMTHLFTLAQDGNGAFPILDALTARTRFESQPALIRGTEYPVRLSGTPRIDERGRFAGFAGSVAMVDETEFEIEDDVSSPAFPTDFGRQLDRTLRGPLERIVAHASSMSAEVDGPLGEAYSGYASDIVAAGRHLLGMITDLADLDAIERPDFAVEPEAIDLAEIARRAAGLLSVRAADGDVRIDRPGEHERLPALGDYRRSLQVMVNLIGNAVRYSPRGGMLWVRVEHDDDRACVIVADQGKGIAHEDHARIFEKFGRVDPGEPGGSGLGLYISRRLARAMGGDIVVDSAPGQGARFIFSLPTE